jgi:hypothetical protein
MRGAASAALLGVSQNPSPIDTRCNIYPQGFRKHGYDRPDARGE